MTCGKKGNTLSNLKRKGNGRREEGARTDVCGRGWVCGGVPTSLFARARARVCVCVCVRACAFLPLPYKKRCIDVVYFVCRAHYGPSRGANEAVH